MPYEVVRASAADIERWRRDPLCPMFQPQVAAAAPAPEPPRPQDAGDLSWFLGPRFRTPGMKPPPSGYFDIPSVPGSASDVENSHKGCAAQEGWWK
jgi:hypothetical protein